MSFDYTLFFAVNGAANRSSVLDAVGIFAAVGLLCVAVAVVAVYWFTHREMRALPSILALLSAALAWLINQGIGELYFRARPFATLSGVHKLIEKSALEKSFPSDHAAFAFALAVSIFLWNRRWGSALLVLAVIIALGRVYVGVHYPSDILAGAVVGSAVALLLHRVSHRFIRMRYSKK